MKIAAIQMTSGPEVAATLEQARELLEEAAARKLLSLERDEKSGGYVIHGHIEGP